MNSWRTFLLISVLVGVPILRAAEDAPEKSVSALLAELNSDDFDARNSAEAALKKLSPAALPQLRAACEQAENVELKLRLKRILPMLAVEVETEPGALQEMATKVASKGFFDAAARAYARLELIYKKSADDPALVLERVDWMAKQKDAERRKILMVAAQKCDKTTGASLASVYAELEAPQIPLDPAKKNQIPPVHMGLYVAGTPANESVFAMVRAMVDVYSRGDADQRAQLTGPWIQVLTRPPLHRLINKIVPQINGR